MHFRKVNFLVFVFISKTLFQKTEESRAIETGNTNALCRPVCGSEEEEEEGHITVKPQASAWLLANLYSVISAKIVCRSSHPCQVMEVNIHAVLIASGIFSMMLEFWKGIP